MELSDLQKNFPAINQASRDVMNLSGPEFTNRQGGSHRNRHICSCKRCRPAGSQVHGTCRRCLIAQADAAV